MTHVKRILASLLIAFLVVAQVTTIPDVAVMGGSNLTTPGAIPYVGSSGTLAQQTTVQWDNTNAIWVHQTANQPSKTDNAFNLFNYRNSRALNILSAHTTALGGLVVDSSAVTSGGGLWVGTGNSTFANTIDGLALFTSTHASSTGALLVLRHVGTGQGLVASNTSASFADSNGFARFAVTSGSASGRVMNIANSGSGDSLYISPGSASTALYIDSTATNKDSLRILTTAQNNGDALRVTVYNAPTGTGKAFRIDGGVAGGTQVFTVDSSGNTNANGTVVASNYKRGTGAPNSAVTGSVGDLYLRTDGGANTTLYVKESGNATNTGWVAK